MTRILYRKDVEPQCVAEIQRFIPQYVWLVPTSIHKIFIDVQTSSEGRAIATSVTPEYHFANITFYSPWFVLDDAEKELHVIHDLIHTANCPFADFTDELIDTLAKQDGGGLLQGYLREHARKLLESMTEDLARSIYDKLHHDHAN